MMILFHQYFHLDTPAKITHSPTNLLLYLCLGIHFFYSGHDFPNHFTIDIPPPLQPPDLMPA